MNKKKEKTTWNDSWNQATKSNNRTTQGFKMSVINLRDNYLRGSLIAVKKIADLKNERSSRTKSTKVLSQNYYMKLLNFKPV